MSGPPDFITPFKFTCCKHNYAHDLPIYLPALSSWDGSSISHPSSACGDLCRPGVWLQHLKTSFQREPGLWNVPSLPRWLCHSFKKKNHLKDLVKVLTRY